MSLCDSLPWEGGGRGLTNLKSKCSGSSVSIAPLYAYTAQALSTWQVFAAIGFRVVGTVPNTKDYNIFESTKAFPIIRP
jgi:hypothetical protein